MLREVSSQDKFSQHTSFIIKTIFAFIKCYMFRLLGHHQERILRKVVNYLELSLLLKGSLFYNSVDYSYEGKWFVIFFIIKGGCVD